MKRHSIDKKEMKIVVIISLIILLLSQLPLFFGYLTQGPNEVFMGIASHNVDMNNHLNWVLQAKEGHLLFTNDFTPEEVPALIFNPFHLIVGNTARLLHTPITPTYNAFGMLLILGFALTLYLFISHLIRDKRTRLLAYLLTLTSAGFGLWWKLSKLIFGKWVVSADLWVPEINTFQSFGQPHFTFAATLLILIFYFTMRSLDEDQMRYAFYAGGLSFLLATIHIFDTVTMAVVISGWFIYRQIAKKRWSWHEFTKIAIIGVMTLPAVAYYFWVFFLNPAYKDWNSLNQTVTPNILALISGFGLIIFFAAILLIKRRKDFFKKTTPIIFLMVWSILNLILVYLPINVQRRFLLGLHIPLSILAAIALVEIIVPYMQQKLAWQKTTYYGIILLLCAATTIYLLITQIMGLHDPQTSEYSNVKYLSTNDYQALQWLDEHTNDSDIIVAPYYLSNYIPAVSGNKVYCGHWAQTINFTEKCEQVKLFYEGNNSFPQSYYFMNPQTGEFTHVNN